MASRRPSTRQNRGRSGGQEVASRRSGGSGQGNVQINTATGNVQVDTTTGNVQVKQ